MNLIAFLLFIAFVFRLAGWRVPLPRAVWDVLSRKDAGQATRDSAVDSGDSAAEGDVDLGSGDCAPNDILTVSKVRNHVDLTQTHDASPQLHTRMPSWLERWAGEPDNITETVIPETSEEEKRKYLVIHLTRELRRPGLTPTAIVRASANQPDAPWGGVSESTVWRVYRELLRETGK